MILTDILQMGRQYEPKSVPTGEFWQANDDAGGHRPLSGRSLGQLDQATL
jgi:hypothetical protein